jgi:Ca-activated chloride channel family protein
MIRDILAAAVLVACLVLLPVVVMAAAPAGCDLALILANDASSSMKPEQKALVRKGTADALRSPDLAYALAGSSAWIMVIEWSYDVEVLAQWTRIDTPADLAALADRTEAGAPTGSQTNMGTMFRKAREFFDAKPCDRQILDVMTDGEPTYSPRQARDESFVEGVHTVNVIFVGPRPEAIAKMEADARFGLGSFVMPVASFADFPAAMRRKLMLEVSWALTGRRV